MHNLKKKNKPRKKDRSINSGSRHKSFFMCIFSLVLVLIIYQTTFSFAADSISWTEDELAFMAEHPVIRIGADPGFVPFEFIDKDGRHKGIAADYLDLISQKTGLKFEVMKGLTWPEVYDKALAGEIDLLPAFGKTAEREERFLFSEPYYFYKRVIVTRQTDRSIAGLDDLSGFSVAVQRNSSHHSYLLEYPSINLSLYDSVEGLPLKLKNSKPCILQSERTGLSLLISSIKPYKQSQRAISLPSTENGSF